MARHLLPSTGTHDGGLLGTILNGQQVPGGGRAKVSNGGGTAQHQKLQEKTTLGEGSSECLKELVLEAIVSIRIVVAVEVPVPGGVVNLPKVKVDALLTILGADSSDLGGGSNGDALGGGDGKLLTSQRAPGQAGHGHGRGSSCHCEGN